MLASCKVQMCDTQTETKRGIEDVKGRNRGEENRVQGEVGDGLDGQVYMGIGRGM